VTGALLVVLAVLPAVVALCCCVVPARVAGVLTQLSGWVSLAAVVVLVPTVNSNVVHAGFLRADPLSVVFLLPTAFLYPLVSLYAVGYLSDQEDVHGAGRPGVSTPYQRLFWVGFNAFAWSMLCAPLADGLAMLWIAVEVTTVVSALLVALDNTEGATEAAWKYVLIASCGLGIALLATIVMYYAGSQPLGQSYDLAFDPLVAHASELPATPVRLAFVLAVVGFGTKVGLVPVHTWLPDAHAEAPTPVSAMLSGSLLAVSFYAILRYYQVTRVAVGEAFPQRVLLVFGIASLLLAALSLLRQSDLKRLLAYSSIEHMGIVAIGVSFGVRLALVGVFLHVLAHAAAKGGAFMTAGTLVRVFQTKSLDHIRGALERLPWTSTCFLVCVLALCAMPPFGLFRSEFDIVAGGLADSHNAAAVVLVLLVNIAFLGLLGAATRLVLTPRGPAADSAAARPAGAELVVARTGPVSGAADHQHEPGQEAAEGGATAAPTLVTRATAERRWSEPSSRMVIPVLVCIGALLVLGVHPPSGLSELLTSAARQLTGVAAS
jgi:hydrogenase-4 component F